MSAVRFLIALLLLGVLAGADEPPPETEDARPVGFPAGEADSGARGRYFRVSATAEPTTVEAEEAFTLTVRITAPEAPQRPPRRIDLADLPIFADRFFIREETEPPSEALLSAVFVGLMAAPFGNAPLLTATALAPQTEWVFVYRLKPRSAQIVEVPVFTFAYYDPLSAVDTPEKRWHVPYADAIALTVRPREAIAVPIHAPEWAFRLANGDLTEQREPWTPPEPMALTLLLLGPPLLGLCWYLVWRRLYPDVARLTRQQRSRSARRALELIARARRVPMPHRAEIIAVAVGAYLRERLDFPAAQPTPDEVRSHLARLGCSAATVEQAAQFIRAIDAVRFQPATTTTDGLADAAESLILALESETSEEAREKRRLARLAVVPLLFAVFASSGAERELPPAALAERGAAAFAAGVKLREASDQARPHFHEAARYFEELRNRGANNAALYRTLGNAHLLADELGQAILAYRRGLRVSPHDTDLRAALTEARQRVAYAGGTFGKPPVERRPSWLPQVRAVWLFTGAALCYAFGWLFLTRWLMLRTRRPLILGLGALVVAAGFAASIVVVVHEERDSSAHLLVVIVEDGVLLLKGNGTTFPPRYETPVNQGVEARLQFERDGWLQIELSGGEVGWVPAAYAVVDRP